LKVLITKGVNGEVGKIGDLGWKGENRLNSVLGKIRKIQSHSTFKPFHIKRAGASAKEWSGAPVELRPKLPLEGNDCGERYL
jgi:hypothetical protein